MSDLANTIKYTHQLILNKKYKDAEKLLIPLLQNHSKNSSLFFQMGLIKYEYKFYAEAIDFFTKAIKLNKIPDFYFYRGYAYINLDKYYLANLDLRRAISLNKDPNNEITYNLIYTLSLSRLGEFKVVFNILERLLQKHKGEFRLLIAMAYINLKLGNIEKAIEILVNLKDQKFPSSHQLSDIEKADIEYNLATAYLKNKQFDKGWELFQSRFDAGKSKKIFSRTVQEWDKTSKGDTILIWNEQGVGDQINAYIYLKILKLFFNKVIVLCDERLISIFERSFDSDFIFLPDNADLSTLSFDFTFPSFGLLEIFSKLDKELQKNVITKLLSDIKLENIHKKNLEETNKKKIGIGWYSKNFQNNGHIRSYELKTFLKYFPKDEFMFINLQYDSKFEDIEDANKLGFDIYHDSKIDLFNDFENLLALINCCDSIISIDNSIIHLAGAANIDTHVILASYHDWRWFDGENIWYKNLHCYPYGSSKDKYDHLKKTIFKIVKGL
jgi:tetratricopeptide (TPR) repeat protein